MASDQHEAARPSHGEASRPPGLPPIDVTEKGGRRDGVQQVLDSRLFMQFSAFACPEGQSTAELTQALAAALETRGVGAVIYADLNDPRGLGLLTWSSDPSHFVNHVRPALDEPKTRLLRSKVEYSMLGRTYATGHEPDLAFTLLERPKNNVLNPAWPFAVWYPLRRSGAFARLDPHEQASILREHAAIGMAYGAQDLAHDVRLACFGLDGNDNEYVIGLIGEQLHPLSHCVQSMRKTRQTSEFIVQMGPFFVGQAVWRNGGR